MLAVVGDLLEDIVVRIATTPALGTDTPATIERRRGGSAANVAAAAATAGAPVRFIGCVGADETGARLAGELEAAVSTSGCSDVATPAPWSSSSDPTASGRCCPIAPRPRRWRTSTGVARRRGMVARPVVLVAQRADRRGRQGDDRRRAPRGGQLSVDVSSVSAVEDYGVERYQDLLVGAGARRRVRQRARIAPAAADRDAVMIIKHGPRPVGSAGREGSSCRRSAVAGDRRHDRCRRCLRRRLPRSNARWRRIRDAVAAGIDARGRRAAPLAPQRERRRDAR